MGWIISKALYEKWHCSQELVAESLEDICSDGKQSVLLNGSHIQRAYLSQDKMTEFSRLSRFGMMFKPLTESRGEDLLMWYREDFLVKTYPAPGKVPESTGKSLECGSICSGLLAKYDHDLHLWKIPQCSLLEGSEPFSETWPKAGMMLNGYAYQQESLELAMSGRAFGFLPTPTAHNAKEGAYPAEYTRKTPTLATHAGGKINPEWTEWLMAWPHKWTDLKPLAMDNIHMPLLLLSES